MTDDVGYAVAAARRLRPDFERADLLQHTGKTIVIGGSTAGRPAVVKVLLGGDPFWRDKFVNEIAVCRAFARQTPPVAVARLVDADEQAGVLIVERLAGRPLAVDRYPAGPLPAGVITAVVDAVATLADWQPPAPLPRWWDYKERLDRYRGYGLLDDDDHHALAVLLDMTGLRRCFAHGDVLPGNIRLLAEPASPDRVALLDWEFAGTYLPGLDLALLWVLLGATPPARHVIMSRLAAADPPTRAAFTINQAMVLTRELRIHREADPGPWRDQRLAALTCDWAAFRTDILHPTGRP
ncbi:phosphotransferase family protein [Sphaerimonospora cavernae]|uniref:Phosphotransferase family protein n=1 Tax=Sphaerimonospora cavernae TaxID=1740611 RepID=A0ABV6U1W0_9ACTN